MCAHTDSLNHVFLCGVYSHYYPPYILLVDPLPLPQVRRWWAAHLQIFFEIFYFSFTRRLNLFDIIMPSRNFFLKIFFLFFKLAVNIQNHLYRILTLNIYVRQNSKYLLVTLRKLLIFYSCYVLYGLFLSFAPRKE